MSNDGIRLLDAYAGPGQVWTGAARLTQEARDRTQSEIDQQSTERRRHNLDQDQTTLRSQIETLEKILMGLDLKMK